MSRHTLNGISRLVVAGAALSGLLTCSCAEQAAPGEKLGALHKELVSALDRFERGGRWKEADSSTLGWGCGQDLQALVYLYQATGERVWLDRLLKYAETMFANLTPNRDGFLSWRSRGYSPAHAEVRPAADNRSQATMVPREEWTDDTLVCRQVKDAEFRLVAQKDATLAVESAADKQALPAIHYEIGKPFAGPSGISLTLKAAPAEGDSFTLITRRPKDFDFAVHDGMVLMPVSRAIELVKGDQALTAVYGERADKLLRVIETQLIPKWDKYWRETKEGGFLVFPTDPGFRPSGSTMPHNQYLPLGTVQITLHRITGKAAYKARAEQMARFFRSCLRLVGDHYEWNYWDSAGEWDKPWDKPAEKRAEDTGHGSLDIAFVRACAENGIVFEDADLKRFADTVIGAMWNGSLDKPTVGGYVNSKKPTRQSGNLQEWVMLCKVQPTVRRVCEHIIPAEGSLWAKAQLYFLWAAESVKQPSAARDAK